MNKDGAGFASNIVCLFEKWRGHVRRVEYSDGINPIFETFKQFVQYKSFEVKINISGRNWMRQKTKIRNINIFHLIILFSLTLFSLNSHITKWILRTKLNPFVFNSSNRKDPIEIHILQTFHLPNDKTRNPHFQIPFPNPTPLSISIRGRGIFHA